MSFVTRMDLAELSAAIAKVISPAAVNSPKGYWHQIEDNTGKFSQCLLGPTGVRIWWDAKREQRQVVIPGEACETADPQALMNLTQLPVKLTRLDVALDGVLNEEGRQLDPEQIYEMIRIDPRSVRTKANVKIDYDIPAGERPESLRIFEGPNGKTVYIGAPQSSRMARIYDSRGFCRIELQIRDEQAEPLTDILAHAVTEKLPRLVIGIIRGFMDFVVPKGAHASRFKLQDWWARIVENVDAIKVKVPQLPQTAERLWKWLKRQAAASVYALVEAAGGDLAVITQLLETGKMKFNDRHQLIVANAGGPGAWTPT